MTERTLLNTKPDKILPMGKGWYFQFGEDKPGQDFDAVYLMPREQYYVRFRVIPGPKTPLYDPIDNRPLTEEEIAHFEALVQEP